MTEVFIVEDVTIAGKPLDPDESYKVAINDFMYYGGDGYTLFAKYPYNEFGTMSDLLSNFLSKASAEEIRYIDKKETLTIEY